MMRRPRRNHSPAFKAKVALAAVKGEKTLAEQFDVHADVIKTWRDQLLEGAGGVGELRFPEGAHGLDHAWVHRRGGVVVQIDGVVGERHGGKMGRNGVWG